MPRQKLLQPQPERPLPRATPGISVPRQRLEHGLRQMTAAIRFSSCAAQIADRRHQVAFLFKTSAQAARRDSISAALGGNLFKPLAMIGAHRRFAFQNSLLHSKIVDLPHAVFNRRRRGALPQSQPRTGGIEHADGFVGQLAPGEIAMRKMHRGGQSLIQNADFVVLLQRRNNAAQHGHALRLDRLFHFHYLETASQRGIFFEILLVFRPGRGGDGAQFAARQRRLQKIRSITLPRLPARADHGVSFVDE